MKTKTKRFTLPVLGLLGATLAMISVGQAVAGTTDFATFTTGVSVHYQGPGGTITYASVPAGAGIYTVPDPYGSLWTVADEWGFGKFNINANPLDDFDEQVVDDGTGNKVWRFSNARTGSFSDQPNSPNSPAAAGESTASLWNDRGLNHTTPVISTRAPATTSYFRGGFRFKSATGATQAGLTLNVSPTARQSDRRNSFVGLVDSGSGLNVTFFDVGIGGTFAPAATIIATGLSYTDWHKIDVYVEFVDGLNGDGSGNDIVTVLVNDVPVHVGTTWETYYRVATPTRPEGAVDALMFRSSGTAVPATLGFGFLFDDVVVDNSQFINDQDCPIISNIQPTLVPINTVFNLTANVNDTTTGGSTIGSATYSIDNGTPVVMAASDGFFDGINENVTATLSIAAAGVYNVCVSATDSAGNTCSECIFLVVYDPSAGFVTGGGWIYSAPGAMPGDPAAEGKANFGFVSKYKKGATVPDGSTEFMFTAGGLNFNSSSYQWLVVNNNGQNAQFKGAGTINGAGNYGFMLWAKDGAKTATPDTFRIQIWDKNNGDAVVYDNVVNQALGGGSIVIHVPKK